MKAAAPAGCPPGRSHSPSGGGAPQNPAASPSSLPINHTFCLRDVNEHAAERHGNRAQRVKRNISGLKDAWLTRGGAARLPAPEGCVSFFLKASRPLISSDCACFSQLRANRNWLHFASLFVPELFWRLAGGRKLLSTCGPRSGASIAFQNPLKVNAVDACVC